jgi:hypothetical protein
MTKCTVVYTYSEELEWNGKVDIGSYLQRRGGAASAQWFITYSEEEGR